MLRPRLGVCPERSDTMATPSTREDIEKKGKVKNWGPGEYKKFLRETLQDLHEIKEALR